MASMALNGGGVKKAGEMKCVMAYHGLSVSEETPMA